MEINIGDIVYNSWGWEQTNIDFYQIIERTAQTVTLRRVRSKRNYTSDMAGECEPIPNDFDGNQPFKKRIKMLGAEPIFKFEFGFGGLYRGEPIGFSEYA